MEIANASQQSIRIKGKSASFVANPLDIRTKTSADCVLLFSKDSRPDLAKIEEYRLVIGGAGDYEVSGAKITSIQAGSSLCHFLNIDNMELCVTSASFLSQKTKDSQRECPVVALWCDSEADASVITELAPRVLVLFGSKTAEVLKSLGKESTKSGKVQLTSDKLPEEMQVTVLG